MVSWTFRHDYFGFKRRELFYDADVPVLFENKYKKHKNLFCIMEVCLFEVPGVILNGYIWDLD